MNEEFLEVRCVECGDFYNKAAMKWNLCYSCSGKEEDEYNGDFEE